MQVTFTKAKWNIDSDGMWLSLKVREPEKVKKFCGEMKDKPYKVDIKEYRKERSLDANCYFWLLVGKMSAAVGIPKEDIYRNLIRDIGDNYTILPIRNDAVESWIRVWQSRGLGWVCDNLGDSKLEGYTNIMNYYGSSVYDTAQMSRLINSVVFECKQLDIETATPEELERLIGAWGK